MSAAYDIFSEELGRWTTPQEMDSLTEKLRSEMSDFKARYYQPTSAPDPMKPPQAETKASAVEELRKYDTYDVEFGKLVEAAIQELVAETDKWWTAYNSVSVKNEQLKRELRKAASEINLAQEFAGEQAYKRELAEAERLNMMNEMYTRLEQMSANSDSWRAQCIENSKMLKKVEAERDAIFHEFTDDMTDSSDEWAVTVEWLRKDFPHLAAHYYAQEDK